MRAVVALGTQVTMMDSAASLWPWSPSRLAAQARDPDTLSRASDNQTPIHIYLLRICY
jgi:hypothetical protein